MRAAPRVIPCLLLKDGGLVKGKRFRNHEYVGDPMNAVKIFNDMEVDELVFLDIDATLKGKEPDLFLIERLAEECYMPFAVGGGIRSLEVIRKVIYAGAEKVVVNSALSETLVKEAANTFGSQAIVASIDVKKNLFGKYVCSSHCGTKSLGPDPVSHAQAMEEAGVGEILLTAIHREGMMEGYDTALIEQVSRAVRVPVIASGGAGEVSHLKQAIRSGASAVAAGSLFVYHSSDRAVLINYPPREQIQSLSENS